MFFRDGNAIIRVGTLAEIRPKLREFRISYTTQICFYYFYKKMNLIESHIKEILNLCKSHKVKSLYAFGSVLTDDFNPESDVDLIVDFQQLDVLDYGDNYYELKFSLENIFKRSVDLLEEKAIKNPFFRETINQKKQLIYGQ
jgi:uncharacterized protein